METNIKEEAKESPDLGCETSASSEDMKDDTPGVKGELMFINTDSFEEWSQDLNTFYKKEIPDQQSGESTSGKELNDKDQAFSVNHSSQGQCDIATSLGLVSLSSDKEEEKENLGDNEEEYLYNSTWINQEKHIFILSESGKPIYTRYGKEDRLVTLFGLMQALVSFVADSDDVIRCINAGGHKFVFLVRTPLILIAVSRAPGSVPQLLLQLIYVHSQIVSVLTASSLTRIFEKRRNYDFRNMLGGTERLLDNLLSLIDHHASFFLGAVKCLPLANSVREVITQTIIQYSSKIKNLVFGLIISDHQLISLVRMKKILLHPADLHLLFNLVSATESLKTSENWMPICLPKFDSEGFLYGHVSYLADDCEACLILLSVDREQFFILSEAKQKIVSRLRRHHCLEKINQAIRTSGYSAEQIGCPELRHFLYKSLSTAQFTSPAYTAPYNIKEIRQRLFGLYQLLHHRIHSVARPLKMMYMSTSTEILVGWVTKEFELYTALEPLTSKAKSVTVVNKILQWVKSEETKYFILSSPTF